jgi:hypothetical protein
MNTFEKLNKQIVYIRAKSRNKAVELRPKAFEEVEKGYAAVIFFGNRYHLTLAAGQDPYQIRKEVDQWVEKQAKLANAAEKVEAAQAESKSSSKKSS